MINKIAHLYRLSERAISVRNLSVIGVVLAITSIMAAVFAYPPAVGILGKSPNCLSCHVDNGSWSEGPDLIIDVIDQRTKESLRQPDGSFLLEASRGQAVTLNTIIGYRRKEGQVPPHRNAWLYVDSTQIASQSLSKFPTGWEVNLPMSCRLVGDKSELYPDADVTVLPMTVLAGAGAINGKVNLQVMLTKGDAIKGNAKAGMMGNFFQRVLALRVTQSTNKRP